MGDYSFKKRLLNLFIYVCACLHIGIYTHVCAGAYMLGLEKGVRYLHLPLSSYPFELEVSLNLELLFIGYARSQKAPTIFLSPTLGAGVTGIQGMSDLLCGRQNLNSSSHDFAANPLN